MNVPRLSGAFLLSLLVAGSALVVAPAIARAAGTFVVNKTGDAADRHIGDGKCDTSATSGLQCTLRAAIEEANATMITHTITFKITTTSKVIAPRSPLPPILEPLTINGYSQTGTSENTQPKGDDAILKIVIDGINAGANTVGLDLLANNSTIEGLVIQRFTGDAIRVEGDDDTIQGNFLGTNGAGTASRGNHNGVTVSGSNDTIGGDTPAARNLISGNLADGVFINGNTTGASNDQVAGNFIGTTKSGLAALGNGDTGVILFFTSAATVGSDNDGGGNVIDSNGEGMAARGCDSCIIERNIIGAKVDGTGDLGNTQAGVHLYESNGGVIGGGTSADGNLIAGNNRDGVFLEFETTGVEVANNTVTNNGEFGVRLEDTTFDTIDHNVISGSGGDGVHLRVAGEGTTGNRIVSNRISANGDLGINLVGGVENSFGVTANDNKDIDSGANDLQNYPVISAALRSSSTKVTGVAASLNSVPSTTFIIEMFVVASDASGFGEGFTFVTSFEVTTNSAGSVTFNTFATGLSAGQQLTMTATNEDSNSTSEFSKNKTIGTTS